MSHFLLVTFILFYQFCINCHAIEPGPKYPATTGEVWPRPQYQMKSDSYHTFTSLNNKFYFTKPYHTCDILEQGINRLLVQKIARKQSTIVVKNQNQNLQNSKQIEFRIELTNPCENYPTHEMDEKYKLVVGEHIVLSSASIWGVLRGMETFNQLLYFSNDYSEICLNFTTIDDYPAYKYRGLLIDTGRHYLKVKTINAIINAMEMNKMNVLHWHIVDDQSFPYQSQRFPTLSQKGAFHPTMVYSTADILSIIEQCRLAGIRVIPEFDVPGHVRSWGEAFPNILTQCYNKDKVIGLGPLDPINNATYLFLKELYAEVLELFPDEYIHLGGDEVDTTCWESNPKIQNYVRRHHIKDINILQTQFMSRIGTLLPKKAKCILWQEVFDSGVPLTDATVLQVWKYGWIVEMDKILRAGHRVVFSSAWYLDELKDTWEKFYMQDPRQMVFIKRFNSSGLDGIIGGEACMWGEKVDDTNILSRIWPRTSAVAERLWTGLDYENSVAIVTDYIRRRIEEHTCRMRREGIPASPPNGPGFCFEPKSSTYN